MDLKSLNNKVYHHLNIYHKDDIETLEKLSVFMRLYDKIESLSHKVKVDPIVAYTPVSKTQALTVLVTGKDLFLSLYDRQNNTLHNAAELDKILYTQGDQMLVLYEDLMQENTNSRIPINLNMRKLFGQYIPKVKREESVINRLPKGLTVSHTSTPFVINIRKNPPFDKHDFAFQIDNATGKCKCLVDGIYHPINSVKTDYNRVYDLFYAVLNVCNGADLSKTSARTILEGDIDIEQ